MKSAIAGSVVDGASGEAVLVRAIRVLKKWRNSLDWFDKRKPVSYLLELIAIGAYDKVTWRPLSHGRLVDAPLGGVCGSLRRQ